MDRIIEVKVCGNHISKDNKYAGVCGEGNVTKLRITFDEGWNGYSKTVTFFDAHGNNPVKRIQGVDLIEDITKDAETYLTPIPPEPLKIEGEMTFVIDGYFDGKRQRSVADKLVVRYSPNTDDAGEPTDPTPSMADQLQGEIEKIKGTIANAAESEKQAKASELEAERLMTITQDLTQQAEEHKDNASLSRDEAIRYAENANLAADRAEDAIFRYPVIDSIGGNWLVWNANINGYVDTGIKAQAGSEVYVGNNPPPEADVWINPDGESTAITDIEEIRALIVSVVKEIAVPSYAYVNILGGADNWVAEEVTDASGKVIGVRYGQVVNVNNAVITKQSKVDLQVTSEQMVVFYEKDIAFVTENEDGVVTVYSVGSIPENDYKVQVIVTEVSLNE